MLSIVFPDANRNVEEAAKHERLKANVFKARQEQDQYEQEILGSERMYSEQII